MSTDYMGNDVLAAFLGTVDETATLPTVDRTPLEMMANCPAQARFVELGRVMNDSLAAAAGTEVHEAFSIATSEYLAFPPESDNIGTDAIADAFRGRLLQARPDVQPDAIDAAWHCAYPWAKFLTGTRWQGGGIAQKNILRYDGGSGSRSGQLAANIDHLGLCVTAEVDFLYAGPAPDTLHETDWKSGFKGWNVGAVAKSFQFQCHAWLVLKNYPQINRLEMSVWSTRQNGPTNPVAFERADFAKYEHRILHAATLWKQYRNTEPEDCPTWPDPEKCGICPARRLCPVTPPESCAADPQAFVVSMAALDNQLDAMKAEAAAYCKATGQDIEAYGLAFGFNKPRSEKKTSSLYLKGSSDAANDE